jgi:hypothetical protein
MGPVTVLSSDAHVFEPPDLWTKRIDAAFRDRAPRMVRVDGADEIVVEQGQVLSGIGLLSNPGVRFEAPERSPAERASRTSLGVAPTPTSTCATCGSTGWPAKCSPLRRACSTSGLPTRRSCRRSFAPTTIISTFETLPSKDIETLPVPVELTGVNLTRGRSMPPFVSFFRTTTCLCLT